MKSPAYLSVLFLALSAPSPLSAHNGEEHAKVSRLRTFGGGIKAKLTASDENRRIEVEYELEDAPPGENWIIVLRSEGRIVLRTSKRTNAVGGLKVRKLIPNGNGKERIEGTARQVGGFLNGKVTLVAPF